MRAELRRASITAGRKPVWATEAGFHNALRASRQEQPGVSEQAAAVYTLRTVLEHFGDGIGRTYLYELLDQEPEPRGRDAVQHFGLLRHDFSRKPAFDALRNLLSIVGRDDRRPALRPLRLGISSPARDLRRLVLQKPDGTYLVCLWRLSSVWDRDRQRPLHVRQRAVAVRVPGAASVTRADPIASTRMRPLRLRHGRARVAVGGRPLVLQITPKRLLQARRR